MTDEDVKLSKTEEKESFLKRLDEKTKALKETEERIAALLERNEELAARGLLGGKSEGGAVEEKPKEETPAEYRDRIMGKKK